MAGGEGELAKLAGGSEFLTQKCQEFEPEHAITSEHAKHIHAHIIYIYIQTRVYLIYIYKQLGDR